MNTVLAGVLVAVAVWLMLSPPLLERLLPSRGPVTLSRRAAWMAASAGVLVAAGLGGTSGAAGGAAVAVGVYLVAGRERPERPDRLMTAQLPDALDFLAVALEAGAPLSTAVAAVAEVSPQPTAGFLHGLARATQLGADAAESWSALGGHPVWGRAAAEVARSARSGTTLVDALRVHATEARQEYRDRTIKAARTVGVKSVLPLMVCFLPAFVLVGVVPIIVGLLGDLIG